MQGDKIDYIEVKEYLDGLFKNEVQAAASFFREPERDQSLLLGLMALSYIIGGRDQLKAEFEKLKTREGNEKSI